MSILTKVYFIKILKQWGSELALAGIFVTMGTIANIMKDTRKGLDKKLKKKPKGEQNNESNRTVERKVQPENKDTGQT